MSVTESAICLCFLSAPGAWRHVEVTDQETLKQEVAAWEKRRNQGNQLFSLVIPNI